ncbi:MAG: tetratricopeptide repeat protein, partial [Candidatus Obscuribacterales bacterium]|nr:tetratricopeptide repeat protein [Candidatus Obscuribacterales bacterium]
AIRELKKVNIKDERLLRTRNRLADVLLKVGKTLDAKDTYLLALKTAKELDKEKSLEAARSLSGLARVAVANEKFRDSEKLIKESLFLQKTQAGENSLGVSENLLDLAELYRKQKLYDNAEPIYELSLEKLDKAADVKELTKADFLQAAGLFFHEQGKMPQANKLFEVSLLLKDKYASLYSPVDARKRGLVSYRCENGMPNAARVFTGNAEVEYMKVKDAVAVATLTPQIYANDWYLLKAEITIQNQGKDAITACAELPTLTVERRKEERLMPLDSDAISRELGVRGRRLYSRLLHSADLSYTVNSIGLGAATTVGFAPGLGFGPGFAAAPGFGFAPGLGLPPGLGVWNTVGGWVNITPDWGARIQARNAAISTLSSAYSEGSSVLRTKPSPLTLNPGETATFQVFYPYKKFDNSTLRFMVGNAMMEFPFTSKSG